MPNSHKLNNYSVNYFPKNGSQDQESSKHEIRFHGKWCWHVPINPAKWIHLQNMKSHPPWNLGYRNKLQGALFFVLCFFPAVMVSQDVRTYVNQRWMGVDDELQVFVTIRGGILKSTPFFPSIPSFRMGNRTVEVQSEGASRTTIYRQLYHPEGTGTFVIPRIEVPMPEKTLYMSPGLVTIRPPSRQQRDNLVPAEVQVRAVWDVEHDTCLQGQFQIATLYLELSPISRSRINWDLGAIAALADSLRRSPSGQWLLHDSILGTPLSTGKTIDGLLRFPCYKGWWACPEPGVAAIDGAQIRVERLWRSRHAFRGRAPESEWEDEEIAIESRLWAVKAPPESDKIPSAKSGPLSMKATWDRVELGTGEPMRISLALTGPVFMGLVPTPRWQLPESLILKGPQTSVSYALVEDGQLLGTKRLDYLLYPAEPGEYALPTLRVASLDLDSLQYRWAEAALPEILVRGEPIPQLRELHAVERFYKDAFQSESREPMNDSKWVMRLAVILTVMAALLLGLAVRGHRRLLLEKRRQQLRSRRSPRR